jgi:hypothetical protein
MAPQSMPPPVSSSAHPPIGGRFTVHPGKPLPDAGGGLPAFLATSQHAADGAHVAIQVPRNLPARVDAIDAIADHIDNLMTPSAHGIGPSQGGAEAYYIICTAPPGPPLSQSTGRWSDRALVEQILKPAARLLSTLQSLDLTHRSIRPDNVFLEAPGQIVTLGAAWATPPASRQPVLFESPYTAMCEPTARGQGEIADDVYALAVLMLWLATGKMPCEGMTDDAIIRAKLSLGSFQALSRGLRLTSFLTDLLSGMLAEDPIHRPTPKLLLDPNAARARRVASSPARRSHDPLVIGDVQLYDARSLAHVMFKDERRAIQGLRNNSITDWLRRGLGDAGVAQRIEEMTRRRMAETRGSNLSDARLLMRAIAALDPRMPLCWRGTAIRPTGIEGLLSVVFRDDLKLLSIVQEILLYDVIGTWGDTSPQAQAQIPKGLKHILRAFQKMISNDVPDAMLRLYLLLAPLAPCPSPQAATAWIIDMPALMRWLDKIAASAKAGLIDRPMAAFIGARTMGQKDALLTLLLKAEKDDTAREQELHVLNDLQMSYPVGPLRDLAGWAMKRLTPAVDTWRNRPYRKTVTDGMAELAKAGYLEPMLDLMFNKTRRAQDDAGERQAKANLALIDAEMEAIGGNETVRYQTMRHFGTAIIGGAGLAMLIVRLFAIVAP